MAAKIATYFDPALQNQKQQISQSTATLTRELGNATNSLTDNVNRTSSEVQANLLDTEVKTSTGLAQVASILEQQNIPIAALFVRLAIFGKLLTTSKLSQAERSIEEKLIAREAIDCQGSGVDMGTMRIYGPENCVAEKYGRIFWKDTRPVQAFLTPVDHLSIRLTVAFPAFDASLNSKDCVVAGSQETYKCFTRSLNSDRRFAYHIIELDERPELPNTLYGPPGASVGRHLTS